ncbi:MAG: thioredoxin family protein [Erysipelotrichaceae bacterium]|nr:thioredoxin family protein [Erysipelotrichaceae bacterium]
MKREEDGKVYHDFYKLPYHHIEFNDLHRIGEEPQTEEEETPVVSDIPVITAEELNAKVSQGDQFALFIYLPGCVSCREFSQVVSEYEKSGPVDIYAFSLEGVKAEDTILNDEIKYTPAVVIIDQGEIVARLLPDKDEDIPYYKNTEKLSEWFHDKIGTEIVSGSAESEITDCTSGCEVHIKE